MKRTIPAALGALLVLSFYTPPPGPIEYRIALSVEGLPDNWTVTVPQYPGQLTRVEVDLELETTGRTGFETTGSGWDHKPYAWIDVFETVSVLRSGQMSHEELATLHTESIGVAYTYDGLVDFDGPSGTTFEGSASSLTGPTDQQSTTPWEGSGSVTLTVDFPFAHSGVGASIPWNYTYSSRTQAGGELVVRYYP